MGSLTFVISIQNIAMETIHPSPPPGGVAVPTVVRKTFVTNVIKWQYLRGVLDHRHSNSGPPFSSFGPSRDYGMDLCLEVYL